MLRLVVPRLLRAVGPARAFLPPLAVSFSTISVQKRDWPLRGPKKGVQTLARVCDPRPSVLLSTSGRPGKSTDSTADDGGDAVVIPDVEAVKNDMLAHVDRLKKGLAKLRGGDTNPSVILCASYYDMC